jgi:hypothetical protein
VKIIVNHERERLLVKRFLKHMEEIGFEVVEADDNEYANKNGGEPTLQAHEYRVLCDTPTR